MILNELKKNCVFDHVFVGWEEDTEAYISWGTEGWGGTGVQTTIKCSKTVTTIGVFI